MGRKRTRVQPGLNADWSLAASVRFCRHTMSVSVPTPPAWAAHEASRGLGPSAPPRSLCPRQPVLNHFPPPILLRAEDGPGKRGWLLDAQARGYQDGKWHASSTLRVHFPHLPLRKKLFLTEFWFLSDYLLLEITGSWVSETKSLIGRAFALLVCQESRVIRWSFHLYPRLPKPSPPPPSQGRLTARASVPYHICGRSRSEVKQKWPVLLFRNLICWSLAFFYIDWYQAFVSVFMFLF